MIRSLRAEAFLHRGQIAARAGRYAAAVAAYDRALAIFPDFAPAHLYRATSLSALGDHAAARAAARQAVVLQPHRAAYRLFQGTVAYDAGRDDRACETFAAASRLAPANRLAAAYHRLARIRRSLPTPAPADMDHLKTLLNSTNAAFQGRWLVLCETQLRILSPRSRTLAEQMIAEDYLDPPSVSRRPFYDRWGTGLARVADLTPARRATRTLQRRGDDRLADGDLQGALDCYAQALERRPDVDDLLDKYLDLCLYCGAFAPILRQLGADADIDALARLAARRKAPEVQCEVDAQAHLLAMLAIVRFHQGDPAAAADLFEAVAASDPQDHIAPYFLGACHLALEAPDTARAWFQKAVSVPNPSIARRRLEEWHRCLADVDPKTPSQVTSHRFQRKSNQDGQ